MSLGTPHYMWPEQAMGEREITARSDVYALGCVTYEMLVGEPPFTGPTAQAIIAKVMTTEPVSLTSQRKSVPAAVDDAVLTALQKLPADRFATAAEFAAALTGGSTFRTATRSTQAARSSHRPWRAHQPRAGGCLGGTAGAGSLGAQGETLGRPDGVRRGPAGQCPHEFRRHLVQRLLRGAAQEYFDLSRRRLHRVRRPPGRLDRTLVSQPA